jgi:hypothetical protein
VAPFRSASGVQEISGVLKKRYHWTQILSQFLSIPKWIWQKPTDFQKSDSAEFRR